MLFLIALAAAAVVGFVLWKAMTDQPSRKSDRSAAPRRAAAPEDDPEFLRQLGERLRREGEDPPRRR
ncbi:MAG TPA: hypothetical protein VH008_04190 [Pseudonocardia sp.]|jgi:hypothetical protein|nr:hypothetical protein [Pseudonocardia sp.]HWN34913.1 hypothetical protein [Pseudonocardia sp.]